MSAQALSAMSPPTSSRQYLLSLKTLQEYCSTDPRWLPYKETASKVYLTNGENKVPLAVDLPRVTRPSAASAPVGIQLPWHTFLERDLASILGCPACCFCLSFSIQTRPERIIWLPLRKKSVSLS